MIKHAESSALLGVANVGSFLVFRISIKSTVSGKASYFLHGFTDAIRLKSNGTDRLYTFRSTTALAQITLTPIWYLEATFVVTNSSG